MFKHWKRKKQERFGEPAIDANAVTEAEINPTNRYEHGRYVGRLLNPDDMFWPETSRMPKPEPDNDKKDAPRQS